MLQHLLLRRILFELWVLNHLLRLVIRSARIANHSCLDHMNRVLLSSSKTGRRTRSHAAVGPQLNAEEGLRLAIPSHEETWVLRIEFVDRLLQQSLSFLGQFPVTNAPNCQGHKQHAGSKQRAIDGPGSTLPQRRVDSLDRLCVLLGGHQTV